MATLPKLGSSVKKGHAMTSRRLGELLWALRLIGHHAGLEAGCAAAAVLPLRVQARLAECAFRQFGPWLCRQRLNRTRHALLRLGCPPEHAANLAPHVLARDWLRRVTRKRLHALPFDAQQQWLRGMLWRDPQALWAAAGGRRRVVCLLPSGDPELAMAALLDRPGAPAHYFLNSPHREDSPPHRALKQLQRRGHRLDIGQPGPHGRAWRQLRQGATVLTVLGPELLVASSPEPAPIRLARLAGVPLMLLGHRQETSDAGTVHVLREFAPHELHAGTHALQSVARAFLADAPHDWPDLDR